MPLKGFEIRKEYEGQTPRAPRHFSSRIISASCLPAKRFNGLRRCEIALRRNDTQRKMNGVWGLWSQESVIKDIFSQADLNLNKP